MDKTYIYLLKIYAPHTWMIALGNLAASDGSRPYTCTCPGARRPGGPGARGGGPESRNANNRNL